MRTSTRLLAAFCTLALLGLSLVAQGPTPKSQKEVDALMAIQNAADPDSRIAAGIKLIQEFADTEFKSWALFVIMQSYEMKNDIPNTIVYAEQLLEAKPSPFEAASAHVRIASGTASQTKEFDLDRDEKIAKVATHAKKGIEMLATAPKMNDQIPDDHWQRVIKSEEAIAYDAMAQSEFVRKKYDEAAALYVKAIDADSDPVRKLKAGNAYRLAKKYNEALAMLDGAINDPASSAQVKQLAENEKKQVHAALNPGA
jgi:tetratricopeptide (TPR) repeat protein